MTGAVRAGTALLLGAAIGAGGCSATPIDRPLGSGGAPSATCPEVTPRSGAPCTTAEVGLSCGDYVGCDVYSDEPLVTCGTNGTWTDESLPCVDPWTRPCPDPLPAAGSSCAGYADGRLCSMAACAAPAIECAAGRWIEAPSDCGLGGGAGAGGLGGLGGAFGGVEGAP